MLMELGRAVLAPIWLVVGKLLSVMTAMVGKRKIGEDLSFI